MGKSLTAKIFKRKQEVSEEYIDEETAVHGHGEGHRPRNLGVLDSLFHLDADWGTSLAYILPLSLALTGRLAPIYMIVIAAIMFIVANGYKIVCKYNPDGGGVYSSLRKLSRFTAVIGALLLITDYIVTIALSISDSYHYLNIQGLLSPGTTFFDLAPRIWTISIILLLTAINWRGPHFSAKFAGIASASTFFLAGFLAIIALPLIPAGLANIGHVNQSAFDMLRNTTGVLLALSGVEAISNMTGIMKNPGRTSRRAINIELVKVLFTTVVLGIAMNALPVNVTTNGHFENGNFIADTKQEEVFDFGCVSGTVINKLQGQGFECAKRTIIEAKEDMLVQMGQYLLPGTIGKFYGIAIGLGYGLLLIFAGNTALIDITNVTYALSKDEELPSVYKKLNKKYGVPIWGLFTGMLAPIVVVLIVGSNITVLASLYAIGVVGAVTLNLTGTAMQVKGVERVIAGGGAITMSLLFVTLVFTKMEATIFAVIVLIIGLTARAIQKKISQNKKQKLINDNPKHIQMPEGLDIAGA
jgi:amino acid transporter